MADDTWFVEKNGAFYGPFSAEKMHAFLAAGKIPDNALVADNKQGRDALPAGDCLPLLKAMARIEAGPETHDEAPPARGEAEWFWMDGGRSKGPYTLEHLKKMYLAGELPSDAAVRRDGSRDLIPLASVTAPPAVRAAVAKKRGRAAAADQPTRRPTRRPAWLMIPLLGMLAVAALWFLGKRQPAILKNFQQSYDKTSPLRSMARQASLPPFNQMVQEALREGLNFSYQKIIEYHADDIENRPGGEGQRNERNLKFGKPAAFEPLFPNRIVQVYSYIVDGASVYTYLVDRDGLVFAVIITNQSFANLALADCQPADFAADARVETLATGDRAWTTRPAPGVSAKAVWTQSAGDWRLDYLLVANQE